MKNLILSLSLIITFSLLIGISNAEAQRSKKNDDTDEYFDDRGDFKSRLWYGGGFNLGLQNEVFAVGISPMVGYKITDFLSVGPKVSLTYIHWYVNSARVCVFGNDTYHSRTVSYSIGSFARAKFLETFFAHIELEYNTEKTPGVDAGGCLVVDQDKTNRLETFSVSSTNFYIGGGYNSGGLLAYEIYFLYNVLQDPDNFRIPYEFRVGFTYSF